MSLSKEKKDLQMKEQNTVLLLIGKTGSGKSTTGNLIFNEGVFESEKRFSSVTRVCQTHTGSVNNRRVTVIDTPDFIFSTHTDFDSDSELKTALELCEPGAHVILLLLSLSAFTKQEKDFIDWFEQKFGVESLRFTLVLFTHANKTHTRTLGEMIMANNELSDFINRCGQRYHEFNIKGPEREVTKLMEKIDRLMSENQNSDKLCYSLEILQETERTRKEEERKAEEEKEAEKERREREYQIELERFRIETERSVRGEYEEREKAEKPETLWRRFKHLFLQQIKLKHVCVFMFFAVVTGVVLMLKKGSSHGWMFMFGFITGGSGSAAGFLIEIAWRLLLKSRFICSSSFEHPSAFRQFCLKTAGVMFGLSAGAVIGHILGGNELPVTVLAGLAGAAGAFTATR